MTKQELLNKADYYKDLMDTKRPFDTGQQAELDNYIRIAYYEAAGEEQVYDYMLSVARTKQLNITEEIIKKLHYFSFSNTAGEEAGQYRRIPVKIPGSGKQPPKPEDLAHLMEHFMNQMQSSRKLMHPIEFAAICHKRLIDIHPFKEGNGRVARLFMNLILINAGYGIASIPPSLNAEYTNALKLSQGINNPDIDTLVELIAGCVIESEKDCCRILGAE